MTETDLLCLRIARRVNAADGIVALELVADDGADLPSFTAGAHIDLHLGPGLIRQYSLCGDPADRSRYRLGILHDPASRGGSTAVHNGLLAGTSVTISRPRNSFPLDETAPRSVLIAGGIGVTPLLAMAYRLHAIGGDFLLRYCTRSRTKTAFLAELTEAPFAPSVAFAHDDGPAEARFDPARDLPAELLRGAHLYVCGPTGFMEWVLSGARALGWPEDRLHLEYFAAPVLATEPGDAFRVRAALTGIEVEVPADRSIADVLLKAGIRISVSCEQGICGACLTPVLEGRPDHRDVFQTDAEKASNAQITVCCSRSLDPLLVLDL